MQFTLPGFGGFKYREIVVPDAWAQLELTEDWAGLPAGTRVWPVMVAEAAPFRERIVMRVDTGELVHGPA